MQFRMFRQKGVVFSIDCEQNSRSERIVADRVGRTGTRMTDKDYIPRRLFRSYLLDRNALAEFDRSRTKTGTKRSVDRFAWRPFFFAARASDLLSRAADAH